MRVEGGDSVLGQGNLEGNVKNDRRSHPREFLQVRAWIADPESNLWSPYAWDTIQILDVSRAGFAFVSEKIVAIDIERIFRIQLPGGSMKFRVAGRTIYHHELIPHSRFRIGVAITEIGDKARDSLFQFV